MCLHRCDGCHIKKKFPRHNRVKMRKDHYVNKKRKIWRAWRVTIVDKMQNNPVTLYIITSLIYSYLQYIYIYIYIISDWIYAKISMNFNHNGAKQQAPITVYRCFTQALLQITCLKEDFSFPCGLSLVGIEFMARGNEYFHENQWGVISQPCLT